MTGDPTWIRDSLKWMGVSVTAECPQASITHVCFLSKVADRRIFAVLVTSITGDHEFALRSLLSVADDESRMIMLSKMAANQLGLRLIHELGFVPAKSRGKLRRDVLIRLPGGDLASKELEHGREAEEQKAP